MQHYQDLLQLLADLFRYSYRVAVRRMAEAVIYDSTLSTGIVDRELLEGELTYAIYEYMRTVPTPLISYVSDHPNAFKSHKRERDDLSYTQMFTQMAFYAMEADVKFVIDAMTNEIEYECELCYGTGVLGERNMPCGKCRATGKVDELVLDTPKSM
jgi:hypothetical protein